MTSRSPAPFPNYRGGKGRAYQHLINLMPPHGRYVETHLGNGAVLRHKREATTSIGIDLDPRVVMAWRKVAPAGLRLIKGDASAWLPRLNLAEGDLVYSDPPYVAASRRTGRYYRHDYGDAEHRRLLDVLLGLDCMVVLSGYRSGLYDEMLASWHRHDYRAVTHNGVVTESVWTNFAPGDVLHDYSYIGATFRQREAHRRRLDRILRTFEDADPVERNAALARVAASDPGAIIEASRRVGCP